MIEFLVILVLVVGAIFALAGLSNRSKARALATAPPGAVRVESVKARWVDQTVARYAQAGWSVTGQTSAKSVGSQAVVTLTFRKNARAAA